jgi:gamma-glutamylcyclotransferase (GGCT)/AIG2-like uncharacterized protein YtfP
MDGVPVFVYGTLRQADSRFGITSLVGVLHEEAELQGFDMLSIGGAFPGLVPGEGTVKGEVHVFEDFETLDHIEGFHPDDPENSLYRRETVRVSTSDGEMEAAAYVFNQDPDTARNRYRRIESGDWFTHRPPRTRGVIGAD